MVIYWPHRILNEDFTEVNLQLPFRFLIFYEAAFHRLIRKVLPSREVLLLLGSSYSYISHKNKLTFDLYLTQMLQFSLLCLFILCISYNSACSLVFLSPLSQEEQKFLQEEQKNLSTYNGLCTIFSPTLGIMWCFLNNFNEMV